MTAATFPRPAAPSASSPHVRLGSLCAGMAAANGARAGTAAAAAAVAVATVAAAARGTARAAAVLAALALAGWWWGSARLDALDRSPLTSLVGTAGRVEAVVTGPARVTRYGASAPVSVSRFAGARLREPALLELPPGRAPPQGAVVGVLAVVREPREGAGGFDQRSWLRRRGIHVVLRADRFGVAGRRGGLGGLADRLRAGLVSSVSLGLAGERRALVDGVVLGEDDGLPADLADAFRRSGLYHLLAVSGQNVALVAGGALALVWVAGLPRVVGQIAALAAILGYVLAVGPQPSVIRAGVAGVLGVMAWLTARQRDRWYFLLLGAVVLLAWNPYTLRDPGFQLSFAAVAAIFLVAPWLAEVLEGYPVPRGLAALAAVSAACGIATAPILWLQFGAVPLLAVPANALADPAVVPLLGLAGASALLAPAAPGGAAAAAWLNGWCAAYLAACARLVAAVPFAQARGAAAGVVAVGGLLGAAYAWLRWRRPP